MEKINKYLIYILVGLLTLALITAGIFGYMWGKQSANNKQLKKDKEEYLQVKAKQDSIIEAANERILLLTDSIEYLVADGVTINKKADSYKTNVTKEKQKLRKDLDAVPNLGISEQLELFSRQSEEYKPGR